MTKKLGYALLSLFSLILVGYAFKTTLPILDFSPWITPVEKTAGDAPLVDRALESITQTPPTPCTTQPLPFSEGFNVGSSSLSCWTIIDGNKDSTSATSNKWFTIAGTKYEGTHSMSFYAPSGTNKQNDDWLISPSFTLDATKTYRLRYYYRTNTFNSTDFDVLLSSKGINTTDFTTTLLSKLDNSTGEFKQENIYITGQSGTVNIAWLVKTANKATYLYIDLVTLEEVNCPEPFNLAVKNTLENAATVTWEDTLGNAWEYYVQKAGLPIPTTAGTPITTKEVTFTQDNTGLALTPDTKYNVYVRGKCSNGTFTSWNTPIELKTLCTAFTVPFNEGFDTGSTSLPCWTIIDANQDSTSPTSSNIWKTSTTTPQSGTHSMYFYGNNSNKSQLPHNDWLVSPLIKIEATKKYRVTYYYKTSSTTSYDYEFELLLSTQGIDTTKFTTVVEPKTKYTASGDWKKAKAFITGVSGNVNLAWHVTAETTSTYLYIDTISIEEVTNCFEPFSFDNTAITDTSASFQWVDQYNQNWEYYVQEEGYGTPNLQLVTPTTLKNVTVTKESNGTPLAGSTNYEFWIRAACGSNTTSEWFGPFSFKTACPSITTFPFTEGFNTNSSTYDCWTIVDKNKNATSPTSNYIWKQYNSSMYEGDRCMYIYESSATADDWLISPTFTLTSGIYKVSYYYKTSTSYGSSYELLISKNGTATDQFTTVLKPAKTETVDNYVKATYYITNVTGKVNIAWHLAYPTVTSLYLDLFEIDKVDCVSPDADVAINQVTSNSAKLTWNDAINSNWEYATVAANMPAPVSGASTLQKNVTVTQLSAGAGALQPNTDYDFYVRSSCGAGKKSQWTGPIRFRTMCSVQSLPFWEGFNTGTPTLDCWTIVDNNNDSTSGTMNIWYQSTFKYEGTHTMQFYGGSGTDKKHDDWLISPSFQFNAAKYYKLTYHYKTSTSYQNDFDVLLSTSGASPANFTKVLLSKKQESSSDWVEETIMIGNTGGTVNFAWQVKTAGSATYLYVDNVFVEEVSCPLPTLLPPTAITKNSATIQWKEDFGSKWEYYIVPTGLAAPTGAGTSSATKSVAITVDSKGNPLLSNSTYDVYARTICSATDASAWAGPIDFTTDCDVFSLPYWEGFNKNSTSFRCWEIVDANNDSTSPTSNNIWKTSTVNYEGDLSAYFYGYNTDKTVIPHNDWLISPKMKKATGANKTYRLKYHYRFTTTTTYDYEFEVLLSDKGNAIQNFTKIIKPKQKYEPSTLWKEEYLYFTGVAADFQIAWHVTAETPGTYLYLDNVIIEEVQTCPEPLPSSLGIKNIDESAATLVWKDETGGTSWEYYVQPQGGKTPTKNGTVTNAKEIKVTTETNGTPLNSNSDYEYYVRTVCGNGEYSIWSGPYRFTTLCATFSTPYWEGFNKDSSTSRCWTILDSNQQEVNLGTTWKAISTVGNYYEGDQAWYYNNNQTTKKHNEWLISPKITLDGGNYVVKYHYKTNSTSTYLNEFEVLLSTKGKDPKDFTTTLVPTKVYQLGNYVEEVLFINGIKGEVNIAWHINAQNSTYSNLYLDNVFVKKVETCAEPYYVKMTNQTQTSMDIEWQQNGTVTEWEVLVVNGQEDEKGTPVQTVTVTGTPKTTITGLQSGKVYSVYVRAKCGTPNSYSDYSTRLHTYTKAGASLTCANAYTIPVNPTLECVQTVSGSIVGAAVSGAPIPTCNSLLKNDVWYSFTATKDIHRFTVNNVVYNATVAKPTFSPLVYGAIYNTDCTGITATSTMLCFSAGASGYTTILQNLTPGQRYYVRLGNYERLDKNGNPLPEQMDVTFTLCVTTAENDALEVSPSGAKYDYEALIKDVFVKSNCDLVSNVKYQIGDGSAATQSINTLGYFNKKNSIFPFEEGIVLSTGEVDYVSGMYTTGNKGSNPHRWVGDKDLNDAINDAGGNPEYNKQMRVTQLEFDFTPIKDSIQFEYLFASNSYISGCTYTCKNGALFAAWLIDSETGEGQNLAKIKGTKTPISLGNIWDNKKITGTSCSVNPELFWMNFSSQLDPLEAPINFAGMTVPMQSDMVYVEPGKKYHIKLAVMDFCTTPSHTSAVFFKAGSFDLGDLNLGKDLLVDNGNALCNGESRTINSGLGADPKVVKITWYKDDVEIPGAISPTLKINESGTYKVTGYYNEIKCGVKGEIKVEIFPPINKVVHKPNNYDICRFALPGGILNLNEVTHNMIAHLEAETANNYSRTYYTNAELTEIVADANAFELPDVRDNYAMYVLVEDLRTGCSEPFSFNIKGVAGNMPAQLENVVMCSSYTLPKLEANQAYYTASGGKGEKFKAGDVLYPGDYTLYLFQDNGNLCFEETSFTVKVIEMPYLHHIDDQTLQCALYVLPDLPEMNKYYIEIDGKRIEQAPGTVITKTNTKVYIVVESIDKTCKSQTSFMVRYDDCPIPNGISPNGDGFNDAFDLSKHGVSSIKIFNRNGSEVYTFNGLYTNQWMGQSNNGKLLPSGTYYYVIQSFDKTKTGWVQVNR